MQEIPRLHVAIILDGNGRWATRRGLPRVVGHRKGVLRVEECVRVAPDLGITDLTLYAFSTENWRRPEREVNALFKLLRIYFNRKLQELVREGVRVRFIGRRSRLFEAVQQTMQHVEAITEGGKRLNLNIAVDYGGRDELTRIAQQIARMAVDGRLEVNGIDEPLITSISDLGNAPSPDLVIRTGGNKRVSNFLLWHIAYSEFEFHEALWPDFTAHHLKELVEGFQARERRFGGIDPQPAGPT